MKGLFYTTVLLLFFTQHLQAQQIEIKGKIIDKES